MGSADFARMARPTCVTLVAAILALANTAHGQNQTQCNVPGECIGNLIGAASVSTPADCLLTCKYTEGCLWYTSNPPLEFCALYSTCGYVNDAVCPDCRSGESSCPLCDLPGLCQGILLHQQEAASQEECQADCAALDPACTTYTYNPDQSTCLLFNECNSLDQESCPNCITSGVNCTVDEGPEDEFIMVIGGWEKYRYYNTVEVVSPDSNVTVPECMQNLNTFPKDISWGAGGVMQLDEIPTVCGGMGPNGEIYSDCLKYDAKADNWTKSGDLSTGRSSPGVTYNLVFGLVMAGGWNRTKYLETVEYTRNGIYTDFLAPLPEAHAGNCLVLVDFNTLFLAGGYGGSAIGYTNKTFILDRRINVWSRMADMPTGRSVMSCGLVGSGPGFGDKEIVVAGGTNIGNARDYVEIFNIANNVWRTAQPLPQTLLGAATVQYQDTFILVGGRNSSLVTVDTLYMYQASDESWIELDAKLQSGKKDVIAMLVKKSNFPQCT